MGRFPAELIKTQSWLFRNWFWKQTKAWSLTCKICRQTSLSSIHISCFFCAYGLVENLRFSPRFSHLKYKCLLCARGVSGHSHKVESHKPSTMVWTVFLSFIKRLPPFIIWFLPQTSGRDKASMLILILQKSKLTVADMAGCLPISILPFLFSESFLIFCPARRLF